VAGNGYSHFGAFLEHVWRQNDVMWGRMDAAGCIIDALMPDYADPGKREEVRDQLIKEAHERIVREELGETGRQTLTTMLLDELSHQEPPPNEAFPRQPGQTAAAAATHEMAVKGAVAAVQERLGDSASGSKLQQLLTACLGEADLLDYVTQTQQTEWKLSPAREMLIATRGVHVFGEVFKGISGGGAMSRPGAWMSLVGRLGSGVTEVALPQSSAHLLWRHWLALIMTFEGLTIAGGLATSTPPVTQFGLMAFVVTLLASGSVWSVSRIFQERKWIILPIASAVLVFGGLMALGVVELSHLASGHSWIPIFGKVAPLPTPSPSP
jgi:hypothetical protein